MSVYVCVCVCVMGEGQIGHVPRWVGGCRGGRRVPIGTGGWSTKCLRGEFLPLPSQIKISLDPPIPARPLAFRWHCPPHGLRGPARDTLHVMYLSTCRVKRNELTSEFIASKHDDAGKCQIAAETIEYHLDNMIGNMEPLPKVGQHCIRFVTFSGGALTPSVTKRTPSRPHGGVVARVLHVCFHWVHCTSDEATESVLRLVTEDDAILTQKIKGSPFRQFAPCGIA